MALGGQLNLILSLQRSKFGPRAPKLAPRASKSVQVGPKCAQVGPKCVQVGPKSVQVGLKLAPRASKLAPSWSPKPPSGPQVRPSWRPRGLQEASRSAWSAKQPEPRNLTTVQRFSWFFQGSAGLERGFAGAWSHLAGLWDGSLAVQRPSWTAKCVQEPPKEDRTARQTGPERPKSTGRRARRGPRAVQQARQGEKNSLQALEPPKIRGLLAEHSSRYIKQL